MTIKRSVTFLLFTLLPMAIGLYPLAAKSRDVVVDYSQLNPLESGLDTLSSLSPWVTDIQNGEALQAPIHLRPLQIKGVKTAQLPPEIVLQPLPARAPAQILAAAIPVIMPDAPNLPVLPIQPPVTTIDLALAALPPSEQLADSSSQMVEQTTVPEKQTRLALEGMVAPVPAIQRSKPSRTSKVVTLTGGDIPSPRANAKDLSHKNMGENLYLSPLQVRAITSKLDDLHPEDVVGLDLEKNKNVDH